MSTQKNVLNELIGDLFAYANRTGNKDAVALVGHMAWLDIKMDERLRYCIMPTGETPISLRGYECYYFSGPTCDKWLIGSKEDMLLLRTLWMAAQDKEIRVFLQQWEECERKQRN